MTETQPARYADWKAPAEDGKTLLWPDPRTLVRDTADNHRRLASANAVRIQNVPLPELRRDLRRWVGHDDDARLLIGTGHQTELYHAGVWAKNALIDALARRTGGAAFHLAVDSDSPKHLHLRWPGASHPITDDAAIASAAWAGQLEAGSPAHLGALHALLADAARSWAFEPLALTFLAHARRLTLESTNLSWVLTNATHGVEWDLGLRHHAMIASPIWASPPYLAFAHHVLARADDFATNYNAALAGFRRDNAIRTPGRPWPDLRLAGDTCEAPFWLDSRADGTRGRAAVARAPGGGNWRLLVPTGDHFVLDPAADAHAAADALAGFLRRHNLGLAPRALTLTAFFRLLLCDQFVHGIGGGRYDQITDRVIETFFNLPAPRFSVTTATLYFPAAVGQRRANLLPLVQEGRRLRHGLLSVEKRRTLQRINALPRGAPDRRALFFAMHRGLAAELDHPAFKDWERRLGAAQRLRDDQQPLFDRELFFAIQPASRLEPVIASYAAALDTGA